MSYKPPFQITSLILNKSQQIYFELGLIAGHKIDKTPLKLRRTSNIQTIQASLAIEGNTLTLDQVTNLLEGKRVIGPPKDILEVQNALNVYANLTRFNPLNSRDFLKAHDMLMQGLINECGQWRVGNVGIFKGKEVSHVAPSFKRVPGLMSDLFHFIRKDMDTSWLLKACIFHYEMEFIHPFADGNGRMGRLWQQLILMKENPLFEFIPVEVLIKESQSDYYTALSQSDKRGDSTPFIEFSLDLIHKALIHYAKTTKASLQTSDARLYYAQSKLMGDWFSRKDYLVLYKDLSTSTASRDLKFGLQHGSLECKGDKNQTLYRFIY